MRLSLGTFSLLSGSVFSSATADVRVATGLRVEVIVTGIARPIQLAFDGSGRLVVLGHGRGDAAAEIYRLDVTGPSPLDVSRAPRVVIPFADEPRKTAFGSLAVDPRSDDLVLGEENGNRIYRLTADKRLLPLAVGLHHLVGGTSLAFDRAGRLLVLDFVSPAGQLRSETAPPGLDVFSPEGYQGPVILRFDPSEATPLPRRLDLLSPLFPRGWTRGSGRGLPPFRLISVAVGPAGDLFFLSALGEILTLTADGELRQLVRLPGGHYHRPNMTVAAAGGLFVASGFHTRQLFRVSAGGVTTVVASELGDPGGVAVDGQGRVYVAETALHRIIRIAPAP